MRGDGAACANAGESVCDFVPGVYNTGTSVATTVEVTSDLEFSRRNLQVAATAFVVLFCVVGLTVWGLPFYYDFMVQQFGWDRAQVTSGNALSKLVSPWMVGRMRDAGVTYWRGCLTLIAVALVGAAATAALPKRGHAQ
jgi:hypothetical protein